MFDVLKLNLFLYLISTKSYYMKYWIYVYLTFERWFVNLFSYSYIENCLLSVESLLYSALFFIKFWILFFSKFFLNIHYFIVLFFINYCPNIFRITKFSSKYFSNRFSKVWIILMSENIQRQSFFRFQIFKKLIAYRF